MLFAVKNLRKHFGGVKAVQDLSFEIKEGEIIGLIGPNGSGKTTVLNLITKFYKPDSGNVYFNGEELLRMSTDGIIRKGIGRTFQLVSVFPNLTVLENLLVPISRLGSRLDASRASKLLDLVELTDLKNEYAKNLSYGQQRLVEFARALMLNPKLLLLDEPVAGISPSMRKKIKEYIQEMNKGGVTFLIVEHNIRFVMDISHRVIVLNEGRKIAEGKPEKVRRDERVIKAYLGE